MSKDDYRGRIVDAVFGALDNEIVDEEADEPLFYVLRGVGVPGALKVRLEDQDGGVHAVYRITIQEDEQ